jgi:hypothetical protein
VKEKTKTCLNCNTPLDKNEQFCSNCGQNRLAVKLSVKQILRDAFSTFFNLDSRLFHTIRDIFKPHKLTRIYVEGRRKYYVNPAKLFLFSLLSLVSLFLIFGELGDKELNNDDLIHDAAQIELSRSFDTIAQRLSSPTYDILLDTIRTELFNDTTITDEFFDITGNILDIDLSKYKFTKTDMATLTVEEILEKYEIKSFKERLITGQMLHFLKDKSGGIRFVIKNFTYVILLLVFLAALVLKILHIRRPYYYVEHLVLLLYGHVLIFILIVPSLLENIIGDIGDYIALVSALSILVFEFISFKIYYRQSVKKTLVKLVAFNAAYLILFISCSVFIGLFSLLIF